MSPCVRLVNRQQERCLLFALYPFCIAIGVSRRCCTTRMGALCFAFFSETSVHLQARRLPPKSHKAAACLMHQWLCMCKAQSAARPSANGAPRRGKHGEMGIHDRRDAAASKAANTQKGRVSNKEGRGRPMIDRYTALHHIAGLHRVPFQQGGCKA